jgi:predicted ATP-binding protein involved in virulence
MEFYLHGQARLINVGYFDSYFGKDDEKYFRDYYHSYNYFAYNGHRQLRDTKVEAFKNFEFNPITEALTFNKRNVNVNLFQWIANNKTRAALSFQKGNKKESERYLSSIQKIENAIGEIIGRNIEFVVDEYSLNVMIKLDNESLHYNTLADGYKSVISWLTDLIFRLDYMPKEGQENFTLFLDEIDIHLHPAAQRRILPVIQKLFPKAQIFLTTHSPFVIGSVDDAWVYKFILDEKGNSVLDGEPFLTEDAKSYRYILEQVFDINKQFGVEIEKKLEEFYKMRDDVIKNSSKDSLIKELLKNARALAIQSEELRAIMGNEIKQLSRILKKEITI